MRPYKTEIPEPGMVHVLDRATGERVGYAISGYTRRWSAFAWHADGRDSEFVGTAHYRGEAVELVWSNRAASPSPTENPQ